MFMVYNLKFWVNLHLSVHTIWSENAEMFETKGLICNDSSLTKTNNPQIVKSGHEIAGPYPLSDPYKIKANIYSKFERLI